MAPMQIAPQGSRASRAARGARSEIRELPGCHIHSFLYLSLNVSSLIRSSLSLPHTSVHTSHRPATRLR